jgi:hypothetical protein
MPDAVVDPLILDLFEWLASGERTYEEVIDVWTHILPETSRLGGREGSRFRRERVYLRTRDR